jgi:hypothetical protein
MTVTALHSTSLTPSKSTHCCFTRRPYHSVQQIRASSRNSITATCQKLFVAWRRCGLNRSSSKAMIVAFFPSHSRPMDPKSSRDLLTRLFEFGMQALVSRCSHPFEAMITRFIPSHSHPMDPKSSRGQMTGPFEFGMQALTLRCSHPFEAIMAQFIPSHSHPMDPKSSRGLLTRPFEFGMQALVLRGTPSRP